MVSTLEEKKPLVTMISKPVVPPWDDSAKNIVLHQVTRGERYAYRILTDGSNAPTIPGVQSEPLYSSAGSYSPGLMQNLTVMRYGARKRGASIFHYFFAPNPLASLAGQLQRTVTGIRTVHTLCSAPATFEEIDKWMFADRVVVLSSDTEQRLIDAGVNPEKVRWIRPGIEPIPKKDAVERRATRRRYGLTLSGPVVLFPGDYEFSTAAQTVARAVPMLRKAAQGVNVVFACRIKRAPSRVIRDRLRADLEAAGLLATAIFVDRVNDMPALLRASDVVVMPSESLYAKMDVPLVLLEAMSLEVPLVLADVKPLNALIADGAGLGIPPGSPEALAKATLRILGDPQLMKSFGQTGARVMHRDYSATAMAAAIESVYDEVMGLK